MEKIDEISKPSGWRVSLSIVMGVGWLIFLIIWLAFYAGNYNVYRNIAIILISILVLIIILGGSWAAWGLKQIPKEGKEMMRKTGFRSRVIISIVIPLALMIFLIIWFYYYADNFNIYQNFAVFLVSILAVGGIMGAMWAPWGMKHGKEFEESYKEEKED
jgi:peptidoglycan/LPS O-acetylase OafA/YrhL